MRNPIGVVSVAAAIAAASSHAQAWSQNLAPQHYAEDVSASEGVVSQERTQQVQGDKASVPSALGESFRDLVYTPVTPCRIVDTRTADLGALAGGAVRLFDVDGSSLTAQGGSSTGCGIPLGVAQAVTMTIVAIQPAGPGHLTAWGLTAQPLSSVLNYAGNDVIADTAIIPVVPGGGDDFALVSLATTHVVVDVLGYFAAASATRLDCSIVQSDVVAVPVNLLTTVDAICGPGRTATGGGYDVSEATIAFPGLFVTSGPLGNGWRALVENHTGNSRNIQTFARCCRVPGRLPPSGGAP